MCKLRVPLGMIALIAVLFGAAQFFVGGSSGWGGGACVHGLTLGGQGEPLYTWTSIGFPLEFVTISTEGCFAARTTRAKWRVEMLIFDVLCFGAIGVGLYESAALFRRLCRRYV